MAQYPTMTPEGTPAMTTTQRRQQLEECRFLEVRHLAYLHYKKDDQTPLMGYEETLDSHERVRSTVLAYEFSKGWLIPDGTEGQIQQAPAQPQPQQQQPVQQPVVQPQPQAAAPQGVPQMNMPFQPPPNGAPVPMQAPAPQAFAPPPAQAAFAPPPQQMAPPPPQQFAPPMAAPPQQPYAQPPQMAAPPPVASPQQAAGVPPQQEAPAQAPTGRRRKAAGSGTAVAPPPAAPPPNPQPQQPQFAQPLFAPPAQAPAQFAPAPQQFAPQAAPAAFSPPAAAVPSFQAPVQQQVAAPVQVDLTPVTEGIKALTAKVESLSSELALTKNLALQSITVLHHLYLTNPSLSGSLAELKEKNGDLPTFQNWLQKFFTSPK
jgi:hypothetical protein